MYEILYSILANDTISNLPSSTIQELLPIVATVVFSDHNNDKDFFNIEGDKDGRRITLGFSRCLSIIN